MDNSSIKQLLEELEIFIGNPNRQSHLETAEKIALRSGLACSTSYERDRKDGHVFENLVIKLLNKDEISIMAKDGRCWIDYIPAV